ESVRRRPARLRRVTRPDRTREPAMRGEVLEAVDATVPHEDAERLHVERGARGGRGDRRVDRQHRERPGAAARAHGGASPRRKITFLSSSYATFQLGDARRSSVVTVSLLTTAAVRW